VEEGIGGLGGYDRRVSLEVDPLPGSQTIDPTPRGAGGRFPRAGFDVHRSMHAN
jgi:hypothetical protein